MMLSRQLLKAFTLTGALWGALGFIYIAGDAWFHPRTLAMPVTHFASFPREDTTGALFFAFGSVCCFVYLTLHFTEKRH